MEKLELQYAVTAQQAAQEIAKPVQGTSDQIEKSLQEQTTTNTYYIQLRDADTRIKVLEKQAGRHPKGRSFEYRRGLQII